MSCSDNAKEMTFKPHAANFVDFESVNLKSLPSIATRNR